MGIFSNDLLKPKGNSGMTLIKSHADDDKINFPDIGFDFYYNDKNCRTSIYTCGNTWVGFTGLNEELKINRRDAGADSIYYANETIKDKLVFRIRWEGHETYRNWGKLDLVWELILFNDNAFVLVIERIPNTGINSFDNPLKGAVSLNLQSNKSYAFIPLKDKGKEYLIKEGSYIQAIIKYLIVDGNNIKHWDSGASSYVKVSELPLTSEKFLTYGDDAPHKERTGIVSTKPTIKVWSDTVGMPVPKFIQIAVPKPIIISMKEDFQLNEPYIKNLKNVTSEIEVKGSGIVKYAVSINGGTSWKSFNGSGWDNLNIDEVKNKGMNIETLKRITEEQWSSLLGSNRKIRFAFYMEVSNSSDILKLKEIRVNYNVE